MPSQLIAGPAAEALASRRGLSPVPVRARLRAESGTWRVYLADADGLELVTLGTYRTAYRAGRALRGLLRRAGWCPGEGIPGLTVREVEVNLPLLAASEGGAE